MNLVGLGFVLVIIILTTADVVARYFLDRPLKGVLEVSEFLLAAMVFLGIAYTQSVRGHIRVDMLVSRFSRRTQLIVDTVVQILGLFILVLIVWQSAQHAAFTMKMKETTDLLKIPIAPFKFLVPLGVLVLCLELIVDLLDHISELRGKV